MYKRQVLLLSLVANRFLSPGTPVGSQLVSELLGALSCALLLVQVVAEIETERASEREAARALASARNLEQTELAPNLYGIRSARMQWAAATLLRLTPASIVSIYSIDDSKADAAPLLRSGRLPPSLDHPMVNALVEQLPSAEDGVNYYEDATLVPQELRLPSTAGSIVLARCGNDCVLIAVSELNDGFNEAQRRWISSLSKFLV